MDFELKTFEDKINDITNQFMSLLDSNEVVEDTIMNKFESKSKQFGYSMDGIDVDDTSNLNKRLEDLYQSRDNYASIPLKEDNTSKIIGSNVGVFNDIAENNRVSYTNDKTSSDDNKEGYTMANYGFNTEDGNSLFSFATVPEERALVAKRSFTDVLFMDIPWDTKIDIWGGIKSLFTTDIKITF